MNHHFWTRYELSLLEEWDWVISYINARYPFPVSMEELQRKVEFEGKLLISNKLVVLYDFNSETPHEILSFKEFISILEKSGKSLSEFKFHPINFKDSIKYKNFISLLRDEVFSMIN